MLFAIDVGNTHSLLGVFDGSDLRVHWRLTTDRARTVDEFGILARTLFSLEGIDAAEVSSMVVSCVVPPLEGVLEQLGREYFDVEPLMVSASVVHDLPIRYHNPENVGPDRIVNAVAAREKYGLPVIVVDFGTATTFDVIDSEGAYLGGTIAPGIGIAADALYRRAARLPRVDIAEPQHVSEILGRLQATLGDRYTVERELGRGGFGQVRVRGRPDRFGIHVDLGPEVEGQRAGQQAKGVGGRDPDPSGPVDPAREGWKQEPRARSIARVGQLR